MMSSPHPRSPNDREASEAKIGDGAFVLHRELADRLVPELREKTWCDAP